MATFKPSKSLTMAAAGAKIQFPTIPSPKTAENSEKQSKTQTK